ncbi:MAG: PLP-dependent aminotransferase family protein [Anaerolineales bacterium]|nr:PLP-dependent aminotransferase family protein [Anaerolineales bacterium]
MRQALPIIQMTTAPGQLDLAWGHPAPELLPVTALQRAGAAALATFGPDMLQYGYANGPGPLVTYLLDRIAAHEGRRPAPEELLVTSGISLGLELVLRRITRPGDVVLVESPTYHLALRIMRDQGLTLVPVPADAGGLRLDALAEAITTQERAGRPARALYLVPTFSNPTGRSLAANRRAALVALAQAAGLLILEDDVYRELAYDAPAPPSLWSLAPAGGVARLGAFSKSLAPGLRLGWLTAPPDLIRPLADGGLLDSGGGLNHFTALVVAALCAAGDYDRNVANVRAAYRHRRDTLLAALREHLPAGCRLETPRGGFFVWVELPEGADSATLLPAAEAEGVAYLPGPRFHLDGGGRQALRLAFSYYPADQLAEAARRLGRALRATV